MGMKDQKQAVSIAEERMKLIAPLLTPDLDSESMKKLRSSISEQNGVSERTLERYCRSYLAEGFEGLKPQGRGRRNKVQDTAGAT